MRILHLVTRRQRRGAEVFATQLADALSVRGHEVTVAGLYAPLDPPLRPETAASLDLGLDPGARLALGGVRKLARYVREARPDIVQANGSDTLKYGALAKAVSRGSWPLVYRNISVASVWLRGPLHTAWNRWLAGRLDHVVSVSEASRTDFISTFGLDPASVTRIPRAVRVPETVDREGARKSLGALAPISPEAPLLVHVGSFTPEKNHAGLLEAFERVRVERPGAHLVLMGDGPLREAVERDVAARGLGPWVHALGSRPDAPSLVAGADLLLLSSAVEGLPGVVLEAAAQAVPSVSTDVGGVREVLTDGETGRVVANGDMVGLADAALDLLADDGRRARMGAQARDLVRAEYDLEAVVGRYEGLYEDLLRSSAPKPGGAEPAAAASEGGGEGG